MKPTKTSSAESFEKNTAESIRWNFYDGIRRTSELLDRVRLTDKWQNSAATPVVQERLEVPAAVEGFKTPIWTYKSIVDVTTGAPVYSGTFGGLADGIKTPLGTWAAGTAHTFRFTVKLNPDTPNADQGKSATATYSWSSVQLDGETFTQ